ncbi:MAG: hypothetical protein IJP24_00905 [Firmicutes bacterium]|nr:hypothetical protein [Bacillota bacterium]
MNNNIFFSVKTPHKFRRKIMKDEIILKNLEIGALTREVNEILGLSA